MNNLTPKQALLADLREAMSALGLPPVSDKKAARMSVGVVSANLEGYRRLLAERGAC